MRPVPIHVSLICLTLGFGVLPACDSESHPEGTKYKGGGRYVSGSSGGGSSDWGPCCDFEDNDDDGQVDEADENDIDDDADHDADHDDDGDTSDESDDGDTSTGTSPTRISTEYGPVVGSKSEGIYYYLGIPYAKPPIDELRWQQPQAPAKWTSVYEARKFKARCAQLESDVIESDSSVDEDCLYLNVWTPDTTPTDKLPVMVYIHGGDHTYGSASDEQPRDTGFDIYDGRTLASRDVVVVTFNYRLGVLGFFPHPYIKDGGANLGNQGLWDQVAALKWVKENIDQFGGDPGNVTLFGSLSGAYDVCTHVVSPKSVGLFEQAIGQSGGCTATCPPTRDEGVAHAKKLAAWVKCDDDDDPAKCLRGKPNQELFAAIPDDQRESFGPIIDGEFITAQPHDLFDAKNITKVPYLLGSNRDDGSRFRSLIEDVDTDEELQTFLKDRFPDVSCDKILAHYPKSDYSESEYPARAALERILADALIVCPTYDTALRAAQAGSKTWLYNLDQPSDTSHLGGWHGADVAYVWGSTALDSRDRDVSDEVQQYWSHFALDGDPNVDGLADWERFSSSEDVRLNISRETTSVTNYRHTECGFWGEVYRGVHYVEPVTPPPAAN